MNDMFAAPYAQALGLALIHFVWQGAAIGIATWLALSMMRNRSPQSRYLVASIGLFVLAVAPVLTVLAAVSSGSTSSIGTPVPFPSHFPASAPASVEAAPAVVTTSIAEWVPGVVVIWMTGVLFLTVRLAHRWLDVQRIRRAGQLITTPLCEVMRRTAHELGVSAGVRLAESSMVDAPTVIGWLRPTILLPLSALAGLTPSQMQAIVAHELAHIRRHDYLVNSLQNVVETLLFYHPAVWWVSHEMRIEREHCCDDLAVAFSGDRVVYAGALASLEEARQRPLGFGVAATGGDLLSRVRRILGVPAPRRRPSFPLVACIAIAVVAVPFAGGASERAEPQPLPQVAEVPAPSAPSGRDTSDLQATLQEYDARLAEYNRLGSGQELEGRLKEYQARIDQLNRLEAGTGQAATETNRAQTDNARLLVADRTYRRAVVQRDAGALERMMANGFYEARQGQGILPKSEAIARAVAGRLTGLDVDSINVQITGDTAVAVGSQIEQTGSQLQRWLFTRVWSRGANDSWTLMSNSVFLDTRAGNTTATAIPGTSGTTISPTSTPGVVATTVPDRPGSTVSGPALQSGARGMVSETVHVATGVPEPAPVTSGPSTVQLDLVSDRPIKIRDVRPAYPQVALEANVQGTVILEATIDEAGTVVDARVVRSVPMLDGAALQAVRQWRYRPALVNGVPVAVRMMVTVAFGGGR